jgi:exonuclease III
MPIKIGTLNLCLGLPNKKEIVKNINKDEKIDILCLQETEIETNTDHNLMSLPGYLYESKENTIKSRVGCYVNTNLLYVRRLDLEGSNSHLVILDPKTIQELQIINIFRCFNP